MFSGTKISVVPTAVSEHDEIGIVAPEHCKMFGVFMHQKI